MPENLSGISYKMDSTCLHPRISHMNIRGNDDTYRSDFDICEDCEAVINIKKIPAAGYENRNGKIVPVKKKLEPKKKDVKVKEKTILEVTNKIESEMINKIYHEDGLQFLESLPDNSIDHLFTTIPKDFDLFHLFLETSIRKVRKHIIINANFELASYLFNQDPFYFRNKLVWIKDSDNAYEDIYVFSHLSKKEFNFTNFVITSHDQTDNKFIDRHKTVFPMYVIRVIMDTFSSESEIWCDPFINTGTVACSAILENRNFIGCDNDIHKIEISNKNINKTLFNYSKASSVVKKKKLQPHENGNKRKSNEINF